MILLFIDDEKINMFTMYVQCNKNSGDAISILIYIAIVESRYEHIFIKLNMQEH